MKTVFKLLGKADDGDAAMGSALGIWNKKKPTIIFSSYRDSNMVIKDVKQISVASNDFSTAEGIHTGVTLTKLKAIYLSDTQKSCVLYECKNKRTAYCL
ncbi:hypothetical protein [Pedobacter sp. NJ-S-72]